MKSKMLLLSAAVVLLGATSISHAEVIYQDTFTSADGTLLSNRPLEVSTGNFGSTLGAAWNASDTPVSPITSTGASAVWTINSNIATIGSLATGADANLIANATIPFTPVPGTLYTLHLDVESSAVGSSGNWLGVAFTQPGLNGHTPSGSASALSNDNPYGLIILKGSGAVQSFAGNGTANAVLNAAAGSYPAGNFIPVDIILDTSNPLWSVSWKLNGTTVGSFNYTTNPNIGLIALGTNKLTGAVDNFSLTAVPEPASLAILGLAGVGFLARRRR